MRRLSAVSLVVLGLLTVGGTALASGPPTVIKIDLTGTGTVNTCITGTEGDAGILTAGEDIVFTSGTVELIFHEPGGWFDASGGSHFVGVQFVHGLVGEGSFGNTYHATGTSLTKVSNNAGDQDVFTSVLSWHLLSSGSEDNLVLLEMLHFTVNANGEVTVFNQQSRVICGG